MTKYPRPHFLDKGSEAFFNLIHKTISLVTPMLWVTMLVVSVLSVLDILSFYIEHRESVLRITGLICFACLKATIFTILINLTRGRTLPYIIAIIITLIYVILSVVNGVSYILYGFGITRQMVSVLSETNPAEVKEFIRVIPTWAESHLLSVKTLMWAGIIMLTYVVMEKIPKRIMGMLIIIISLTGVGYITLYFARSKWGKTNHFSTIRTVSCVVNFSRSQANIQKLMSQRRDLAYPETASSRHYAKNVILVIGESASRSHHSLYGYRLPTTPRLDSISEGLYVFTNAKASSTLTSENIPRILTFMTDEPGQKEWYEYPTIIQVMKAMGYKVGWISNQERTGLFSNVSTVLSSEADVIEYVGAIDSEDHTVTRYDEEILAPYKQFISDVDTLRMACLHLMGSHIDFRYRYPPSRSRFKADDEIQRIEKPWIDKEKAQVIAEYDNSICYTDSVLNEVIASIRENPEPSVMVYLSDHGHTVYDRGDYYGRDELSADVPFLVYVNGAYADAHPEMVKMLETSLHKPFSTSETIQMVLSLTGGEYKSYDATSDPLSSSFRIRKRYFDGEEID